MRGPPSPLGGGGPARQRSRTTGTDSEHQISAEIRKRRFARSDAGRCRKRRQVLGRSGGLTVTFFPKWRARRDAPYHLAQVGRAVPCTPPTIQPPRPPQPVSSAVPLAHSPLHLKPLRFRGFRSSQSAGIRCSGVRSGSPARSGGFSFSSGNCRRTRPTGRKTQPMARSRLFHHKSWSSCTGADNS